MASSSAHAARADNTSESAVSSRSVQCVREGLVVVQAGSAGDRLLVLLRSCQRSWPVCAQRSLQDNKDHRYLARDINDIDKRESTEAQRSEDEEAHLKRD